MTVLYKIFSLPNVLSKQGEGPVYWISNEEFPSELVHTLLDRSLLEEPIRYLGTSGLRNLEFLSVIHLVQLAQRLLRYLEMKCTSEGDSLTVNWLSYRQIFSSVLTMRSLCARDHVLCIAESIHMVFSSLAKREGSDISNLLAFFSEMELKAGFPVAPKISAIISDHNPDVVTFWRCVQEESFFKDPYQQAYETTASCRSFIEKIRPLLSDRSSITRGEPIKFLSDYIRTYKVSNLIFHQHALLWFFSAEALKTLDYKCEDLKDRLSEGPVSILYVSNIHDHGLCAWNRGFVRVLNAQVQPALMIASYRSGGLLNGRVGSHPSVLFNNVASYEKFVALNNGFD